MTTEETISRQAFLGVFIEISPILVTSFLGKDLWKKKKTFGSPSKNIARKKEKKQIVADDFQLETSSP